MDSGPVFHAWFALLADCLLLIFFLAYSLTLKMDAINSSETSLMSTDLHGVIIQKI
jgi:hypothetical protein